MRRVLVANTKGGSGKTTLATNLAGYLAQAGYQVVLEDSDRQQSTADWLARRPAAAPSLLSAAGISKSALHKADWVIEDSPGGLKDKKISDAVKHADLVLVPIAPSAFDIGAAGDFLAMLAEEKKIRKQQAFVGLIGMRVTPRTKSAERLQAYIEASEFEMLSMLRASQLYVTAAEEGLSIFELKATPQAVDVAQWKPITDWLFKNS